MRTILNGMIPYPSVNYSKIIALAGENKNGSRLSAEKARTWGTLRKEGAPSRVYIKINFVERSSHIDYTVFVLILGCDVIAAFQSA